MLKTAKDQRDQCSGIDVGGLSGGHDESEIRMRKRQWKSGMENIIFI